MLVGLLVFVGWLVLCALDAHRFGWSRVPVCAQAIGAVLIALCMIVVWQVFRFNSFAAPQVRVQIERQQRAITDGPYRIVRHPMYAGALLMFVGTPLLLGSWWGLLFVPLGALGIGIRAVAEERMLRREVAGYEEYSATSGSGWFPASGDKSLSRQEQSAPHPKRSSDKALGMTPLLQATDPQFATGTRLTEPSAPA
jgi:protein-S-isoprenylcysteine O-methyltransferase Ste14